MQAGATMDTVRAVYPNYNRLINARVGNTLSFYSRISYALFIFLLVNNLIGTVPYSFASTSHFSLTFFLCTLLACPAIPFIDGL